MRIIMSLTVFALFMTAELSMANAGLATASAEYRTLPREYRLDGLVEAVNRATVSAQTQGQVQEILYDVDDFVEKNAVLVRLKDTEHRARVSQAGADLKSAAARLQQVKDERERIAGLYAKKSVSESAMDKANADLANAQAGFDSATARLDEAEEQLAYTQIRAPYSGIVTERQVALGEIARVGSPVMSGISLDELRVNVDIPQSVIPALRGGQKPAIAKVYLQDGEVIESSTLTVFPYADPGSNTFKVRIDLPANQGERRQVLFPGMFVKTGFIVGEKRELTIPASAVVHRSEVTAVYVIGDGERIQFRQIRLGRQLPDAYVVLSGLSEGERVALDPIAAGGRLKSQASAHLAAAAGQTHE
jgi:RND family efflux transporter MFP subunit